MKVQVSLAIGPRRVTEDVKANQVNVLVSQARRALEMSQEKGVRRKLMRDVVVAGVVALSEVLRRVVAVRLLDMLRMIWPWV